VQEFVCVKTAMTCPDVNLLLVFREGNDLWAEIYVRGHHSLLEGGLSKDLRQKRNKCLHCCVK
jgi:hypothetical protein